MLSIVFVICYIVILYNINDYNNIQSCHFIVIFINLGIDLFSNNMVFVFTNKLGQQRSLKDL